MNTSLLCIFFIKQNNLLQIYIKAFNKINEHTYRYFALNYNQNIRVLKMNKLLSQYALYFFLF